MRAVFLLFLCVAVAAAVPARQQRIVGGQLTDISRYPFAASLVFSSTGAGTFHQACGGTILTVRAILSAAHCFMGDAPIQWRARLGSSTANSGGRVYNVITIIIHASYNPVTFDSDVAMLHVTPNIVFGGNIATGRIAGAAYNLPDNSAVWAIGWGLVRWGGQPSERLRHVQVWTVNQIICRQRYLELGLAITDNMLCSGWLNVGGRDACTGDSGGPLLHNNIVFGITSWGYQCALPRYPGVSVRVPRFTGWIQTNA